MTTMEKDISSAKVPKGAVRLWWLCGAGFAFKTAGGRVIYVDPYLSDAVERLHGFKRLSLAPIATEKVKVDCFAPAIGTSHGIYKGEPKIAFERLKEISQLSDTPLALHGGTGLSEAVFKKCIQLGCAKVNISTQLKYAFIDGFLYYHQANPKEYNPLAVLQAQYSALKIAVAENILLFGSNQRA